jgi:hypothetical protein
MRRICAPDVPQCPSAATIASGTSHIERIMK